MYIWLGLVESFQSKSSISNALFSCQNRNTAFFGEPTTPELGLSVEIVSKIHWKASLILVSVIEAGYLTIASEQEVEMNGEIGEENPEDIPFLVGN